MLPITFPQVKQRTGMIIFGPDPRRCMHCIEITEIDYVYGILDDCSTRTAGVSCNPYHQLSLVNKRRNKGTKPGGITKHEHVCNLIGLP